MSNMSRYMDIELRRRLIMDSYSEIFQRFSYPSAENNRIWAVSLVLLGWLLSFFAVLLMSDFNFLKSKTPNKAVFFAAFNEKIRKVFRCQRPDTFPTIMMGATRVLATHIAEEPAVLMFLVPPGSMPTARALVILLTHCLLLSWQYPASLRDISPLLVDGSGFRSNTDEWPFFHRLRKALRFPGVAVVFGFERIHPQAVRTLQSLVPMVYAPYPQSVLMLVVDMGGRFNHRNLQTMSANEIGKMFLSEQLGAYFDESELTHTINLIGSRCIVVNPEQHVEDFES